MTNVNNNLQNSFSPTKVAQVSTPISIETSPQIQTDNNLGFLHKRSNLSNSSSNTNTKLGFFGRIINFFKSIFGFGKITKAPIQEEKIPIEPDQVVPKSSFKPKVFLYSGFLDLDYIAKNKDKYIFVLAGNLEGRGGHYGQSAILRPALEAYPDSIVELPVTKRHANVLDPATLAKVSFDENSVEDVKENLRRIEAVIDDAIQRAKATGKTILMLKGGYGTGAARMYAFAPETFKGMNKLFKEKLGVKYLIEPVTAQYSLDYLRSADDNSSEVKSKEIVSVEDQFSPERLSQDLWANGWALARHRAA